MAKQPISRKNTKQVNTENTAVAAPRTLAERLASAEALVIKLKAQIVAEKIKGDIEVGGDITFSFGRGESKREYAGTVAALADTDQGKIVAASVTDDLGLPEIKRVNIRDVLVNRTAEARRGEEPTPVVSADADPLDAE